MDDEKRGRGLESGAASEERFSPQPSTPTANSRASLPGKGGAIVESYMDGEGVVTFVTLGDGVEVRILSVDLKERDAQIAELVKRYGLERAQ